MFVPMTLSTDKVSELFGKRLHTSKSYELLVFFRVNQSVQASDGLKTEVMSNERMATKECDARSFIFLCFYTLKCPWLIFWAFQWVFGRNFKYLFQSIVLFWLRQQWFFNPVNHFLFCGCKNFARHRTEADLWHEAWSFCLKTRYRGSISNNL